MEQETTSLFYAAIVDTFDKAKQLRTSYDSVLAIVSDGITASHLVGGNADHLEAILLNMMQKNTQVATIVCAATLEYYASLMESFLKASAPQPPSDAAQKDIASDCIAQWPDNLPLRYKASADIASPDAPSVHP